MIRIIDGQFCLILRAAVGLIQLYLNSGIIFRMLLIIQVSHKAVNSEYFSLR